MTTPTALVRSTSSAALHNAIALWADATTAPASTRRARPAARQDGDGRRVLLPTPASRPSWSPRSTSKPGKPSSRAAGWRRRRCTAMSAGCRRSTSGRCRTRRWRSASGATRCGWPGRRCRRPYQAESTQALTDDELRELLRVVKRRADAGDVVGKRDYAMLLFYVLTGMRRAEIAGLRWGDVRLGGTLTITAKVKGGEYAESRGRASRR